MGEVMSATLDLRILELLSARMCPDLISPVSAVGNGVELITEFDDQMQGEALALIGESARSASQILQFYRAAFGSARSADGGLMGLAETKQRILGCLDGGRIEIIWPDDIDLGGRIVSRIGIKLLMNMVMLGTDLLPGTGCVSVSFDPSESAFHAMVHVEKDGFTLADVDRSAITGILPIEELTPRTIVGYYCHIMASSLGQPLEMIEQPSSLTLGVMLPWA
jgi:histidine phosphotransferase ChpT